MFNRLRKSIAVVCCLVMAVGLTACGDSGSSSPDVDISALVEEMKQTDTSIPKMSTVTEASENAETTFSVLADFDYAKIEKFVYSYSETGSPEEIAVILTKEKANVGDLMKALQAHIDSRRSTFKQYDPEQASIIEGATLTFQDRYVLLAIAPTSGAMQDIFKKKFS